MTTSHPATTQGEGVVTGQEPAGGGALTATHGRSSPAGPILITAYGNPAPQGSKNHNRYSMWDDNAAALKPWRRAICDAAERWQYGARAWPLVTGPCTIEVTITLPRPNYHYRTGRYAHLLGSKATAWPTGRGSGDSDKYLRAICDAITDSGLWTDDVLAVEALGRKVWVGAGIDALDRPGAIIRITPLAAP